MEISLKYQSHAARYAERASIRRLWQKIYLKICDFSSTQWMGSIGPTEPLISFYHIWRPNLWNQIYNDITFSWKKKMYFSKTTFPVTAIIFLQNLQAMWKLPKKSCQNDQTTIYPLIFMLDYRPTIYAQTTKLPCWLKLKLFCFSSSRRYYCFFARSASINISYYNQYITVPRPTRNLLWYPLEYIYK